MSERGSVLSVIVVVAAVVDAGSAHAQDCDRVAALRERATQVDELAVTETGAVSPERGAGKKTTVRSDGLVLFYEAPSPGRRKEPPGRGWVRASLDRPAFDKLLETLRDVQHKVDRKREVSIPDTASFLQRMKVIRQDENCVADQGGADLNVTTVVDGHEEHIECVRGLWSDFTRAFYRQVHDAVRANGEAVCR